MNEKGQTGILKWIKENLVYFVGFLLPFVILGVIFIKNEIYPFGDNIYLRSDMYHQYAPFYKELYEKLVNGGSLTFSWEIGMGVNFSAIYAYYLASPVNLLLGLVPENSILIVMDVIILIKTALAGFACTYYLSKRFHTKSFGTAGFALFYAMSSYMAAFSWNIMWLDCVVLLPFVILGLESLVKEKKFKLYTISLGIAIFSNYYIAIMICIFVVLYFLVLLAAYVKEEKHFYIDRILRFGIFSALAGGLGAIMILPEVYALGYTASGDFKFPETWVNYFSILDMLRRSLIEIPVAIFEAHDPNVYCTVAVFLLIPVYCISSKVNKKEKIGKIILIALLLVSFNTNIPNYIWHGFHFPNSLPARESFIYIFLIITMCFEAYLGVEHMKKRQLWGCFAGGVGVILLLEEIYQDDLSFNNIYVTLALLVFYMVLIIMTYNKVLYKEISTYLLLVICAAETFINSSEEASYKPTTYSAYLKDNQAIEELVAQAAETDHDFYRIEKLNRKTKNDAAWNGYKGVSIFSSMANAGFTEYLGRLGFEQSMNAYSYYGFTPFTSALLSVKYVFAEKVLDDTDMYTLTGYNEQENRYLYRVNYCLPLGFMLPENFLEEFLLEGNNPFAIQNQFAELAAGESELYTYIQASTADKTVTINVEEDSDVYVYVTTYVDSISFSAYNQETGFSSSDSFSGLEHRRIVHFGEMPAGTVVTVNTSDSDATTLQLYAYDFNSDVFDRVYEKLSSEPMEVAEYEDNYVKASVNAKSDGLLYTSIIYDRGWSVFVDGKEVEYTSIKDALMAVPITAGEHTLEFRYYPQGKKAGTAITAFSAAVLAGFIVLERKKKKNEDRLRKNLEEIKKEEAAETPKDIQGPENTEVVETPKDMQGPENTEAVEISEVMQEAKGIRAPEEETEDKTKEAGREEKTVYMGKIERAQDLEIEGGETELTKEERIQDSGIDQKAVSEIMDEME